MFTFDNKPACEFKQENMCSRGNRAMCVYRIYSFRNDQFGFQKEFRLDLACKMCPFS